MRLFPFLKSPGSIQSRFLRRAYMVLISPLLFTEYMGHGVRSFLGDFKSCWAL